MTRDIDIAILSVCLSVPHVPVLYRNGLTYISILSLAYGSSFHYYVDLASWGGGMAPLPPTP